MRITSILIKLGMTIMRLLTQRHLKVTLFTSKN